MNLAMNQLRETVVDTGPRSFVVLGVAATALLLGAIACVLRHRRRRWTGLPGRLAVAAASLALLASGLVIAAAQAWRSVVIHYLLPSPRPPEFIRNEGLVILGYCVQFAGLVFIGALMLLALTVVALGLALSWRAETAMSRLRAVALLLPAWPVAAGLLLYGLRMNAGYVGVAGTDPSMKTVELLRSVDGAYPIIATARAGLLLLVAVGAIATVVASTRGACRPVSSVRFASSVLVFLTGLVAFALTRGHAADRHPLPILPDDVDAAYASTVPSVSPCPRTESAPLLEFADDFVKLNGIPVDPDEFQLKFESARVNHALLHSGGPMPYLGVMADRATRPDRIIPYLQKVSEGTNILVASATSHPFVSNTLGTIARYAFCGRPFRLAYEKATPLSRYPTWSDVAAAVSRSSEMLEIAPW